MVYGPEKITLANNIKCCGTKNGKNHAGHQITRLSKKCGNPSKHQSTTYYLSNHNTRHALRDPWATGGLQNKTIKLQTSEAEVDLKHAVKMILKEWQCIELELP